MKNFQNQTTILLIESNSDWLADVRLMLQETGYDVLTTAGGDQGFCVAQRIQPDLIVCEAALPDLSGIQLCYMFRADKKLHSVPFILMGETGDRDCDTAVEGLRAGADDCFEKDCKRQFLAARIARLIALRRSEAELSRRCRNLRRTEMHLGKIIEDTSNLVAALDPAHSVAALNEYDAWKLENFFNSILLPKKHSLKRNADALANWKRTLQADGFVGTDKFRSIRREAVFYEVVC